MSTDISLSLINQILQKEENVNERNFLLTCFYDFINDGLRKTKTIKTFEWYKKGYKITAEEKELIENIDTPSNFNSIDELNIYLNKIKEIFYSNKEINIIKNISTKTSVNKKKVKINFNDDPILKAFKSELRQIKLFLEGSNLHHPPEKLYFWVWFCYTFELYNEGAQIFRKIEKDNMPQDFHNIIKKLGDICEMKM